MRLRDASRSDLTPRSAGMAFHIRRLEPIEVLLLRQLRIAALRDAPDEFAGTVEDGRRRPGQEWLELATSAYVTGPENVFVGLVFAYEVACASAVGRVGGLWVAP